MLLHIYIHLKIYTYKHIYIIYIYTYLTYTFYKIYLPPNNIKNMMFGYSGLSFSTDSTGWLRIFGNRLHACDNPEFRNIQSTN